MIEATPIEETQVESPLQFMLHKGPAMTSQPRRKPKKKDIFAERFRFIQNILVS
jgi:hypothetical protein